jgi:hypothetical protein
MKTSRHMIFSKPYRGLSDKVNGTSTFCFASVLFVYLIRPALKGPSRQIKFITG